ncbi:MAG: acetyl-CoA carboxylase carboxyltransferase subunit alpha [Armatimonadetes bacterium]|nr:acetyl-CoA carboxylase carboxyltransferase subunit alpha [Armatimonadota bacterium]
MSRWLEFDRRLREVDEDIVKLERLLAAPSISDERRSQVKEQIAHMRGRQEQITREVFARLSAWDNVLLARHADRPYTLDFIGLIFDDFVEVHGDRRFGDDPAMVAGLASLDGRRVAVIGQQKAREVKERQFRNFGSAHPEGYRKTARVMKLAEKLKIPVISFVDTPAAESRLEAEERGIANAIAENMLVMSQLETPIVATIIGEGGSGGAIGIAVADRLLMLEHAVYSVIPPESCAVILEAFGRDPKRGPEAAEALRLSAERTRQLGAVDTIIPEPLGGAQRDPAATAQSLKAALIGALDELEKIPLETLLEQRYQKFRKIGHFRDEATTPADGSSGAT